ncbi:MAG: TetR/AcrR family transcriptional regulator [Candidatus Cloacimonetes bacterium]|nr:TetR/AcrR family transcriptional regulator [Candidatus Cloacimonadota bacterium]MCF7814377.1 TetR/AcrR family transcriptional regulator [Candidatus Cloacimonadota bacterium]MCF7869000.1 TetR/AcrR family transcriptional regulator [Candidatus Cloacimonadota bacterium]MCF7884394.1 TetR/AcrR family transcriptional regulator [Candidatus Cloacimonadota bacterium]
MNKRQFQKQKTRQHILKVARQELIRNGFLNATTAAIAQKAEVAHGTLFLHFKNKNMLILEILDKELSEINRSIQKVIVSAGDFEQMLLVYLNELQRSEDLFSVLARELPFYSPELRRMILFRQSIIREHFHKFLTEKIAAGLYEKIKIPSALNFFFGTLNYYLSLKNIFVKDSSVIEKFKTEIIETFLAILTKREEMEDE